MSEQGSLWAAAWSLLGLQRTSYGRRRNSIRRVPAPCATTPTCACLIANMLIQDINECTEDAEGNAIIQGFGFWWVH